MNNLQNSLQPQSLEAEQALLSVLLRDPQGLERVESFLSVKDFFNPSHREIYQTMLLLDKRQVPCDLINLIDLLKKQKTLDAMQEDYLFELVRYVGTSANLLAYANLIRTASLRRQLLAVANEISRVGVEEAHLPIEEMIDAAEEKIFALSQKNTSKMQPQLFSQVMNGIVKYLETVGGKNRLLGLSSGFAHWDEMTQGLQAGDLIILAARPGVGKTALALNIALHAALQEKCGVLMFSLEMTQLQLGLRVLSNLMKIPQNKLRAAQLSAGNWEDISQLLVKCNDMKLVIDDSSMLTPNQLRQKARRVAKEIKNLGLIVVDYLQLLHSPEYKNNPTQEIADISRKLKTLGRELNVPVLALSQLNRNLEYRNDKRPMLADLRQSGSIEQDADIVAFIHREDGKREVELIMAKHRHGAIGKVKLEFDKQFMQFKSFRS